MKNLMPIVLTLLSFTATGQAGIFQDAKGESAIKLFGSSVALSTKDESINFAAGRYYRTSSKPDNTFDRFKRLAATLELKANEGIANLKDENNYLIDGSIGLYHGWKNTSKAVAQGTAFALERFVSASIGVDRNKLFNISLPQNDMVYSKGQFVYKAELGQFGYTGALLYGISGSFKQQTNIDDIKTKSVSFVDYASANDSTFAFRQKQAYDVKQFIGAQHVFSINADGALLLNSDKASSAGTTPPVFLGLHLRYQHLEDENGQFNPALGFYLGKHGAPRNIIGGFNIQFLDILNSKDEKTNAWDRATINFVVGFKFAD